MNIDSPIKRRPSSHGLGDAKVLVEQARILIEQLDSALAEGYVGFVGADGQGDEDSAPDVRQMARLQFQRRRLRAKLLGEGLFADPAWDMLIYMFGREGLKVFEHPTTHLCRMAGERSRRAKLTPKARKQLASYFCDFTFKDE